MSFFFLPRFLFGTWIWTLIYISPTWVRDVEFRLLYPLVYDYGGLGQSSSTLIADLFCFIANLYWFIMVILIILGLYIFDAVFLTFFRELMTQAQIAFHSLELAQIKDYAKAHIGNLDERLKEVETEVQNNENNEIVE